MINPHISKLSSIKLLSAVSVLAMATAGCASQADNGRYYAQNGHYRPAAVSNANFSDDRHELAANHVGVAGIEAARDAHRRFDSYRAEQLDGYCEHNVAIIRGETLSDIAEFCDVSIAAILEANPQIRRADRVSAGESIVIPIGNSTVYADDRRFGDILYRDSDRQSGGSGREVNRYDNDRYKYGAIPAGYAGRNYDRDYYIVKRNDTLGAVAHRYNVSLHDLLRANPDIQPRRLEIGQRVYLPASANIRAASNTSRNHDASYRNAPVVAITPAHGARGEEIRIVGENFKHGDQLTVLYGDSKDGLVQIRTIETDMDGRFNEPVQLPVTYDRELAYFAVQRGSDTYMSQSYRFDNAKFSGKTASPLDSRKSRERRYGAGPSNDGAALIAIDQDMYRGGKVTLVAHSFPANAPVSLYVGPTRNALVKTADTRTGPEGVFQAQVDVPENMGGGSVIFAAALEDGSRTYFSDPVRLRTEPDHGYREGSNYGDTSSGYDPQIPYRAASYANASLQSLDRGRNDKAPNGRFFPRIRNETAGAVDNINVGGNSAISGVLTNEGINCPTLRDDAGNLYSLLGDLRGFDDGDRVLITGSAAADRRLCGQSDTIQVFAITRAVW